MENLVISWNTDCREGAEGETKNTICRAESAECCSSACMHGSNQLYLPLTHRGLQDAFLSPCCLLSTDNTGNDGS